MHFRTLVINGIKVGGDITETPQPPHELFVDDAWGAYVRYADRHLASGPCAWLQANSEWVIYYGESNAGLHH